MMHVCTCIPCSIRMGVHTRFMYVCMRECVHSMHAVHVVHVCLPAHLDVCTHAARYMHTFPVLHVHTGVCIDTYAHGNMQLAACIHLCLCACMLEYMHRFRMRKCLTVYRCILAPMGYKWLFI